MRLIHSTLVCILLATSLFSQKSKASSPTQLRMTPSANGFVISFQPGIRWITRAETGIPYWLGSAILSYGITDKLAVTAAYGQGEAIGTYDPYYGINLRYTFHTSMSIGLKSRFDVFLGAHKGGFGDAIDGGFVLANRAGSFGMTIGLHIQGPYSSTGVSGLQVNGIVGIDLPVPFINNDKIHMYITASPSINNDAINTVTGGITIEI